MALTRISVTLLLLVGIMTVVTFAENQDRESEEDNEYGDVQKGKYLCRRQRNYCVRRFRRCKTACNHNYYYCLRLHRVVQDVEESTEDSLTALDQPMAFASSSVDMPAEFEEENENGNAQHRYKKATCYVLYGHCICRSGVRCKKACLYGFRKCVQGRRLIQDDEENLVE